MNKKKIKFILESILILLMCLASIFYKWETYEHFKVLLLWLIWIDMKKD